MENTGLLYPQEHIVCPHYVSDRRCYFKYVAFDATCSSLVLSPESNHLLFVRKGAVIIEQFNSEIATIKEGGISFIPKSSEATLHSGGESQLLICSFDVPLNICDKLIFQELPLSENADKCFQEIPTKEPMMRFVDSIIHYLHDKINCEHLHEIKQKEMFFLFKWYYTKDELSILFRELAGNSLKFKSFILSNYQKANLNVNELAKMAGMSRTRFDVKFKNEFKTTPLQWMQTKLANKIEFMASEPEVTINQLMDTCGFTSRLGFIRFCKQQFNCTPKELLLHSREAENPPFGEN